MGRSAYVGHEFISVVEWHIWVAYFFNHAGTKLPSMKFLQNSCIFKYAHYSRHRNNIFFPFLIKEYKYSSTMPEKLISDASRASLVTRFFRVTDVASLIWTNQWCVFTRHWCELHVTRVAKTRHWCKLYVTRVAKTRHWCELHATRVAKTRHWFEFHQRRV
jgi:hypothetical protein